MHKRVGGSSARGGLGFGVLVLGAVIVSASASVSSFASPRSTTLATQEPPSACVDYVSPSSPAVKLDRPFLGGPQVSVCGSFKNDELKINRGGGHGTQIWAGPGNDRIEDQNGAINEIWGGTGKNSASIDICKGTGGAVRDTVHDVGAKGLTTKLVKCPGLRTGSSRRLPQQATEYPKIPPFIHCGRTGGRHWIGIEDPEMRAVDATRNVDFQTVAFSAVLYRLGENGDWTRSQRTAWLWDRTFDEQISAFPGNYWRSFKGDTRIRKFVDFLIDQSGVYEVRIHYRWYAANGTKTHDITERVSYHLGPFQNRDQSACDFPGLPLPEGVYSGLTDEQQTVSLKVGPLYSAPPKATAWSLVESFEFTTTITCTPAVSGIEATWRIDATNAFFIGIRSDGTFSSTHAGPVPGSDRAAPRNGHVLRERQDRPIRERNGDRSAKSRELRREWSAPRLHGSAAFVVRASWAVSNARSPRGRRRDGGADRSWKPGQESGSFAHARAAKDSSPTVE